MFSISIGIFTQTLKREIWAEEDVTIVWHDMRTWEAPEKAGEGSYADMRVQTGLIRFCDFYPLSNAVIFHDDVTSFRRHLGIRVAGEFFGQ